MNTLRRWLARYTFSPTWLPARLRHPLVGCVLSCLLALTAALIEYVARAAMPLLMAQTLLSSVTIVVVALLWGLPAALLASLVSTAALNYTLLGLQGHMEALLALQAHGTVHGWIAAVGPLVMFASLCLLAVMSSVAEGRRGVVREQRQQALVEAARAEAVEQMAQMRSDFVSTVSHELRTPLTAIIGYGELLASRWDHIGDDHRREQVQHIVAAANRQLRLVQDLLLLSRLESGPVRVAATTVNLREQLQRATQDVRAAYGDTRVDLAGPPDLAVRADPDRLMQVLVNLLDNAVKYSPAGSPVDMRWACDDAMATLWVQDRGTGIPEQHRSLLFTRFGRVPGTQPRSGRCGTGLGLYLSRQLAEAMQGTLDLAASGPTGTTFCLRLPVAVVAKAVQLGCAETGNGVSQRDVHSMQARQPFQGDGPPLVQLVR